MDDNESEKGSRPEGKGKGKGKEMDQDASSTGNESFISRVTNSAAALSRSLVNAPPSANDISRLTTTNKSGGAATHHAGADGVGESSRAYRPVPQGGGTGFRPSQTREHITREEANFADFLDNVNVQLPPKQPWLGEAWRPNETASPRGPHGLPDMSTSASIADQQSRDGNEVVQLLSLPEDEMPDDQNNGLSDAELSNLHEALFGTDSHGLPTTDWDHVLNFIPEFVRPDGEQQPAKDWESQDSQAHLGIPNSAESGRLWIEQWHDVLTRYTDEVWGDLGSLVRQAREEVRQLGESERAGTDKRPASTKALQRLGLILSHVRGH